MKLTLTRLTRTDFAQMFKAVDSGRMAIGKFDLHGIVAHCRSTLGRYARLKHRQYGTWSSSAARRGHSGFFLALIIAQSARTIFSQIRKIEVAGMAIGPCNVNALARCDAHFHVHRFFSHIVWYRHSFNSSRLAPVPLRSCQLEPVKAFAIILKSRMVRMGAS